MDKIHSLLALLTVVPVGLLPVIMFLLLLIYLDTYRMVRMRLVLAMLAAGGVVAVACYFLNGELMDLLGMNLTHYSRWVAPIVEETLKASVVLWLFGTHRIGFLVDSIILGFAVGAGFAVIENFYYLYLDHNTTLMLWIVRGFGTAVMHGGVVAIFAVITQTLAERSVDVRPIHCLPGLLAAMAMHSIFNHFFVSPVLSTVGVLLILPPLLYLLFRISEHRTHDWLEVDFDEDAELMRMLDSGNFGLTPAGQFLGSMRDKLEGTLVADMLCYLRVYTELALRAKGLLLARENGLDVGMDDETHEKFRELHYLERSIGVAGRLTMRPFLQMTTKDLWQLYVLGK
ncbi:MAG: PrsW family intramembrane metalloprotease [Proteobacteria bacterium]|nr:PrsW family intramembrane metalloprotease [Pseudomonadota bacterium]